MVSLDTGAVKSGVAGGQFHLHGAKGLSAGKSLNRPRAPQCEDWQLAQGEVAQVLPTAPPTPLAKSLSVCASYSFFTWFQESFQLSSGVGVGFAGPIYAQES